MTFTEKGFEFVEKNGGACVTKILTPGAACVIPESLGGMPVTELADRAVANQPHDTDPDKDKSMQPIGIQYFMEIQKAN